MQVYYSLIRFNFSRFLTYPLEIWAIIFKYIFNILFLCVFWSIIAQGSNGAIDTKFIVSYLIIAQSIGDFVDGRNLRFARFIGKAIKSGNINNSLIKPVKIIPYMLSDSLGERSFSLILATILLIIGIAINPPTTLISLILTLVFMVFAFIISLAFNLIIGILFFYSPEASGFRFVFNHISSVFAGTVIPLIYFPEKLKALIMLTPFPGMIFTPTYALHLNQIDSEVISMLITNLIWAIILPTFAFWWWNKSLKHYDAIGI